jgi:hypothetical protein
MTDINMQAILAKRHAALETLDLTYARSQDERGISDEALLIGLHKARVECTAIANKLRLESVEWLRERGYKRMFQQSLPEPGVLPE